MKSETELVIKLVENGMNTSELLRIQRVLGREVVKRTLFRGIAAHTDWWTCTSCGMTSYGPDTHGYRTMPDGTIRSQPQCKRCRSIRKPPEPHPESPMPPA